MSTTQPYAARIPTIDHEDRLLFGLTAHELGIIASALGLAGGLAWLTHRLVPALPPVFLLAVAVPVVAVGFGLAVGQRDGLSLDRLAVAAVQQARTPKRMVAAPNGVPAAPAWLTSQLGGTTEAATPPVPLTLPAQTLDADGVLDLGSDGTAVICQATPVNLSLRTPEEQTALISSYARFLHSLTGPVQLVLRAHPVDLSATITQLTIQAAGLPHPALEAAARQHAEFLSSLTARRDALRRDLLLVIRDPRAAAATGHSTNLLRRVEEAAGLLAVAGVHLRLLDHSEVAAVLTTAPQPRWSGGERW